MNSTVKIIYWQDGDHWLGYVEEYPDYMTQGLSLPELKKNLKDLYNPQTKMAQPVPRHNEINENLAKHILKKMGSI